LAVGLLLSLVHNGFRQLFCSFLIRHDASFLSGLQQVLSLWIPLTTLFMFLYVPPTKAMAAKFKFNPQYPKWSLMIAEGLRSFRGVVINAGLMALVPRTPTLRLSALDIPVLPSGEISGEISSWGLLKLTLVLYIWADFHFYWSHRLLHAFPRLYAIHKVHHASFNPTPLSGLSMHPVESAIYFSSASCLALVYPFWVVRVLHIALTVFPLDGHSGFGSWSFESQWNHYIHHSKFHWNFGSSPLWDHICGTNYIGRPSLASDTGKAAVEQAKLAGFELKPNDEDEIVGAFS